MQVNCIFRDQHLFKTKLNNISRKLYSYFKIQILFQKNYRFILLVSNGGQLIHVCILKTATSQVLFVFNNSKGLRAQLWNPFFDSCLSYANLFDNIWQYGLSIITYIWVVGRLKMSPKPTSVLMSTIITDNVVSGMISSCSETVAYNIQFLF